MSTALTRHEAIGRLRGALAERRPDLVRMIEAGPVVRAQFQPLFAPDHLPELAREEFLSFLVFRNNQHWVGLHRKGPEICSNMSRLRTALGVLLDESRPIAERLNDLAPGGRSAVPGMGRAVLSAILLVMRPDAYGVWNNRSQATMEQLGVWPKFDRGEPFGQRYSRVNAVLLDVARELGTDLWTLDGLWWAAAEDADGEMEAEVSATPTAASDSEPSQSFGLERHLHEFLRDNWERTSLGRDWDLHSEDGEVVGYEYPTPIGRIDLLAHHKRRKAWLVIELKRNQSSDDTVGQALRYMGYVREHVAGAEDKVEGLIVSHHGDDRIRYALTMAPAVSLMLYEVDFRLKSPPAGGSHS